MLQMHSPFQFIELLDPFDAWYLGLRRLLLLLALQFLVAAIRYNVLLLQVLGLLVNGLVFHHLKRDGAVCILHLDNSID